MRQHWSDNDRHHCSETALARLALEQGCEANSAPQELKNNNKKKQKNTKRDATLRSTCKPLASFERWFVFHFIGSPSENETSDQEIGPAMPTSFSSDSGCQPGIVYKRHTRKGPLQDFWAKDTTPLRAIRFSFSEMKHWCEARTPTPTWIDGSLTIMNRYLVTRLLIWMTQGWQRKNEIETFLPADGAAMTDTLLIDK